MPQNSQVANDFFSGLGSRTQGEVVGSFYSNIKPVQRIDTSPQVQKNIPFVSPQNFFQKIATRAKDIIKGFDFEMVTPTQDLKLTGDIKPGNLQKPSLKGSVKLDKFGEVEGDPLGQVAREQEAEEIKKEETRYITESKSLNKLRFEQMQDELKNHPEKYPATIRKFEETPNTFLDQLGFYLRFAMPSTSIGQTGKVQPLSSNKKEIATARKYLKVTKASSADDIKNAYISLAKQYHPDTGGSTKLMTALNKNYEVLTSVKPPIFNANKIKSWFNSFFKGKSKTKSEIIKYLSTGENAPQEIINAVFASGQEGTTEGKKVIQIAVEAKNKGQNIIINPSKVKIQVTKPPQVKVSKKPTTKRAVVKLDKKPEGVKSAIATIKPDGTAGMAIVIDEKFRKKGIGSNVVKELENKILDKGIKKVSIKSFPEAQKFWEKQGYSVIKRAEITKNSVPMEKTLSVPKKVIVKPKPVKIKPKPKVKIKPKTVSVPREQLPVGEGKIKVSRLEARVKGILDKAPQEAIDKLGITTFNQMNKKATIAKASKYVISNPDDALKVLRGEIEVPKGLPRNSIYVAMQNNAIGDVDLARKLASLSSTRFGQELSILTEIDPDSPVKLMTDVVKVRRKAFGAKYKNQTTKQVTKKVTKQIKTKIKKINKFDWNSFIRSIEC